MTEHDPCPSDDELRAWRERCERFIAEMASDGFPILGENDRRTVVIIDALLSERAAHLATKAALRTVRDELDDHGYGDMHYGDPPGYRDPDVLAALEVADRALADPEEPQA